MRKRQHKSEHYLLLSLPENDYLFAVERKTHGPEKFVAADPKGRELGPVYEGMAYIISPYINHLTGRAGESCTCVSWLTRQKRCVHLKKFFEMNPQEDPPDIYRDTNLEPVLLEMIETICQENQKLGQTAERVKETLGRALQERAYESYRTETDFAQKLAPWKKDSPASQEEKDASQKWLLSEMRRWATHYISPDIPFTEPP